MGRDLDRDSRINPPYEPAEKKSAYHANAQLYRFALPLIPLLTQDRAPSPELEIGNAFMIFNRHRVASGQFAQRTTKR
jgi:hypothetical protein